MAEPAPSAAKASVITTSSPSGSKRHRRRSIPQVLLLQIIDDQLRLIDDHRQAPPEVAETRPRTVIDLGGGTGGVATTLAQRGHQVTVVDPSPDALASLERRTAELGLSGRVRAMQGDASGLIELVGTESADLVLCHRVLDVVDSPAEALAAVVAVLRPGGLLSLLVSQRHASVMAYALAGQFAAARAVQGDQTRLDHASTLRVIDAAGLTVVAQHGLGTVADYVSDSVVESTATGYAELLALETELSTDPTLLASAPSLHVTARRPIG